MTPTDFVNKIQKYYSPYQDLVLLEVEKWVALFSPATLDELYEICKLKYSNVIPNSPKPALPPDICMLNKVVDEAITQVQRKERMKHIRDTEEIARPLTEEEQAEVDQMFADIKRKWKERRESLHG